MHGLHKPRHWTWDQTSSLLFLPILAWYSLWWWEKRATRRFLCTSPSIIGSKWNDLIPEHWERGWDEEIAHWQHLTWFVTNPFPCRRVSWSVLSKTVSKFEEKIVLVIDCRGSSFLGFYEAQGISPFHPNQVSSYCCSQVNLTTCHSCQTLAGRRWAQPMNSSSDLSWWSSMASWSSFKCPYINFERRAPNQLLKSLSQHHLFGVCHYCIT